MIALRAIRISRLHGQPAQTLIRKYAKRNGSACQNVAFCHNWIFLSRAILYSGYARLFFTGSLLAHWAGRSPFSGVRTTVHVQHLPRYLTGFREINHGFHYVLDVRDCPRRRERPQEVLRGFCSHGVSTTPGATALKRIFSFAYSMAKLRVAVSRPPFVIIGTDAVISAMGLAASEAVIVTTLPPNFCVSICLTARCVT